MRSSKYSDHWKFADFFPYAVTYRATKHQARSANSLVCKFSYIPTDAHESAGNHPKSEGWNADFLKQVGLGELVDRGLGQIGGKTGDKLSVKEGNDEGEALVLTVRAPPSVDLWILGRMCVEIALCP